MNNILIKSLWFLVFILLFVGCKKDNCNLTNCPYTEEAPPRYIFAPDSAKTDSIITITVVYNNQKQCQQFSSFSSNTVDSTTTISLKTKIDSCNCQTNLDVQYQYLYYQAPHIPGHSIIKIHVLNSLFYGDTITIY